jgi:hypothetical protein
LIAADAGSGSVPLEVRLTRRWRGVDSNFQYAEEAKLVAAAFFLRRLLGTDRRAAVQLFSSTSAA